MTTTAPFDVSRAHRWFAVELNNLAWELVEAPERSAEQSDQMLHAAHGACFHWLAVGAPVNHLRALCLVASAHLAAGDPPGSLRWAEKCLALHAQAPEGQTAWDRATALGCAAHALAASGRIDEARVHYRQALEAAEQFEHEDERPLFDKLYPPLAPSSGDHR